MQASREPEGRPGHNGPRPIATRRPELEQAEESDAETVYVRIKRADLERILALVERLERRID